MHLEKILSKLISFRTVSSDQAENKRALDWIETGLADLPLHVKRLESNGFHSLVATTRATKKPKIMLAAHLDVVPAPPESFRARRVGDRLYGRGACDMKFAVACYLRLLRELKPLKNYDLGMMITTDEEVGGKDGTGHVLRNGYRSNVVLLPDAGFNWQIDSESKGAIVLEVVSRGVSAHSARPWEGQSAIADLMDFLAETRGLFTKEPCGSHLHRHDTMNVGKIEGGKAINQIANRATAWIDIRYMPNTDKSYLMKKILAVAKRYQGISIKETIFAGPCRSDVRAPEIKLFRKIAKEKYGIETTARLAHGASDGRFFTDRGILPLILRPRAGGNHTSQEWISLKDMERFYGVMREWVEELTVSTEQLY